jgi:uncharacterized protein (DUF2147 family)
MRKTWFPSLIAASLLLAVPAATAENPTGDWTISSGRVTVRIVDCGAKLCGTIVALARPLDKAGKPKLDRRNPNPALRARPMIGVTVFNNMKPEGSNAWAGKIYNADDGRTYSASAKLDGNRFTLKACVASILCKKIKFVRVQ